MLYMPMSDNLQILKNFCGGLCRGAQENDNSRCGWGAANSVTFAEQQPSSSASPLWYHLAETGHVRSSDKVTCLYYRGQLVRIDGIVPEFR